MKHPGKVVLAQTIDDGISFSWFYFFINRILYILFKFGLMRINGQPTHSIAVETLG